MGGIKAYKLCLRQNMAQISDVMLENKSGLLLLKDLLFVFGPNIHELSSFVNLHWIVHQAVHVDKLHSPLLRVIHHGRDD